VGTRLQAQDGRPPARAGARAHRRAGWRTALRQRAHDPRGGGQRNGGNLRRTRAVRPPIPTWQADGADGLFLVTEWNEVPTARLRPRQGGVEAADPLRRPQHLEPRSGCASSASPTMEWAAPRSRRESARSRARARAGLRSARVLPAARSGSRVPPCAGRTPGPGPDRRRPFQGSWITSVGQRVGSWGKPGVALRVLEERVGELLLAAARMISNAWRPVLRHWPEALRRVHPRGPARTELETRGRAAPAPAPRSGCRAPQVAAVKPPSEDPQSTTPPAPTVSASRRCSIRVTVRSKNAGSFRSGILELDAPFLQALLHELALAGRWTAREAVEPEMAHAALLSRRRGGCARSRTAMKRLEPLLLLACVLTVSLAAGCGNACLKLAESDLQLSAGRHVEGELSAAGAGPGVDLSGSDPGEQVCQAALDSQEWQLPEPAHAGGRAECGIAYTFAPLDAPSDLAVATGEGPWRRSA